MAAVQLNFTLRTSAHCKTVHLLGSWDNYNGQLPLSKDSAKAGGWKGTFRFQGQTLKQGQRYWYYYIIDGYHVSHDPARPSVVEPTTGRKLNTLDIPAGKTAAPAAQTTRSSRTSRRTSDVPKGRSLSPSQIKCPRPQRDYASKALRAEKLTGVTVEQLAARFALASVNNDESSDEEEDSDDDSDVPSLTSSRSSNNSSPSSVSSVSSCCTCERYGITRGGSRVKLDCGGSRCGYSDSSECSSESEDEYVKRSTRRQGMVVRS
ncbi:hypothetical protein AMS68_003432 [Peltaster fructicola]|uniref:AMP-activated protein kinase glycogen-binding domain-containing protein n=1 Tax=Peltaster fructicola TaxID=286661 RepID=A0A6H0XTE3_9PEZI|nr:hypothetical protein AMS68_003432 [Peltaster fructicola]